MVWLPIAAQAALHRVAQRGRLAQLTLSIEWLDAHAVSRLDDDLFVSIVATLGTPLRHLCDHSVFAQREGSPEVRTQDERHGSILLPICEDNAGDVRLVIPRAASACAG